MRTTLTFAILLASGLTALPVLAQDCPAAVPFEPDDRLADLAARCGVAAGAILRANEAADETALRQMDAVAIPQPGTRAESSLLERARAAVENTAEQAEGMASQAGNAAADYLSENNLGSDLLELGQSTGLLAAGDATAEKPHLSAIALDTERVRIAATGLQGNQVMTVALVQDETTVPLQEVTTEADGTLLTEIARPPQSEPGNSPVFTLEADGRRVATASLEQR